MAHIRSRESIDRNVEQLNEKSGLLLVHFRNKLLKVHPDLTKGEVELCALVKLQIPNKEIADFKNIAVGSVKNLKNRLKRKLGLSVSDSLTRYIDSIHTTGDSVGIG